MNVIYLKPKDQKKNNETISKPIYFIAIILSVLLTTIFSPIFFCRLYWKQLRCDHTWLARYKVSTEGQFYRCIKCHKNKRIYGRRGLA